MNTLVTWVILICGALALVALFATGLGMAIGYAFDRYHREVRQGAYDYYRKRLADIVSHTYPHSEENLGRLFADLATEHGYQNPWDVLTIYREREKKRLAAEPVKAS